MTDDNNGKERRTRTFTWTQDPEGVKREILEVALQEFAEKGLAGARVDEIAAKTSTSKRMIYYYYTDKDGLYRAALEEAYFKIRAHEKQLLLDDMSPREALAELTGATFDHHLNNADFVRLVMAENLNQARHLAQSERASSLNLPAIDVLRRLYERGVREKVFRPGVEPLDIHLTINSMSFYNVSNRYTIRQIFGHDMAEPGNTQRRRKNVIEAVLRFVQADN